MRPLFFGPAARRPVARLTATLVLSIAALGAAGALPAFAADPIATETTLGVEPAAPVAGQSVNLIATVKVKSDGSPVTKGAVDYTQDLTVFGIANVNGSGKATLGVSAFPAGAYSFGASYADTSPITFASSEAARSPSRWSRRTRR